MQSFKKTPPDAPEDIFVAFIFETTQPTRKLWPLKNLSYLNFSVFIFVVPICKYCDILYHAKYSRYTVYNREITLEGASDEDTEISSLSSSAPLGPTAFYGNNIYIYIYIYIYVYVCNISTY